MKPTTHKQAGPRPADPGSGRSAAGGRAGPIEIRSEELAVLAEEARAIITRWFEELAERPVSPTHDPAELAALLDESLPDQGAAAEEVLADLRRLIPYATAIPSPRYYGLLNPAPTPISVYGEAIAGALNLNLGAWRHGTVGVSMEERLVRWLADLFAMPGESGGTFTSGGTEANLTAVACARHRADPAIREGGVTGPRLVGYVSREGHFSLDRSFDLLGLGRRALRAIDSDARCRIRTDELRARIAADRAQGLKPFLLVGILGTTSSGAVDPLPELAEVAAEEELWFHVDAAYGGGAALSSRLAPLCAGVERADSITVDPHKWFFVPFSAGVILVRDASVLPDTFAHDPVYIRDLHSPGRRFFREGVLGSRRFNGLKLWLSLKRYGRAAYGAAIERQVDLTRLLYELLRDDGRFVFPHEPVLAIGCFRWQPGGMPDEEAETLASRMQQAIEREGRHWISTTVVGGKRWLRVNVNSYLTSEEHIRELVDVVVGLASGGTAAVPVPPEDRQRTNTESPSHAAPRSSPLSPTAISSPKTSRPRNA